MRRATPPSSVAMTSVPGVTGRPSDPGDQGDPGDGRGDPRSERGPAMPVVIAPGAATRGLARGLPLRREGPAKLTGEALYADDLVFEDAWYGGTIRSTDAHARFLGLELDDAFDWSSVVIATAADIPGENVVSLISDDQPILVPVGGEIQHHAEPLALVAAPDPATLRAALARARPRTEPLPAILDPERAERTFTRYEIRKGDVAAGLAAADLVVEGTYRTGHQEQLYIEPMAMIAVPSPDGGTTVHGSLQCPFYVHAALARGLGVPTTAVRVVQAETGGGFGGKEEYPSILALHAAVLARRAGRPIRMIYDRHEDIAATTKRHPSVVRHRTGVMRDGRIVAEEIEVLLDGGAYCTLTPVVLSRASLHAGGPYDVPDVHVVGRAVATNTPPNGAFRGFGAPQVHFAIETHLNRIAEALGLSPAELRRRNVYRPGGTTPTGQQLIDSVAAEAVLEAAVERTSFDMVREWTARERGARLAGAAGAPDDRLRTARERTATGIGLALAWHGAGFTGSGERRLASVATLELTAAGRVTIAVGSTEIGQGTSTILPMLVAAELGIPDGEVDLVRPDTAIVPDSGPTVASRSAMVVGGLLVDAARRLRERVEARNDGRPFAEVYRDDARHHGSTRIDERFAGYPGIEFDDATYAGDAYPAYGWAAAIAVVDVDLDTAEVAVRDVVAVDDVGRVIHPILAEGQVEGGTLQSVGWATIEEIQVEDGRYRNDRLATYLIPTALDAPRIQAVLIEAPFPLAPHRAKGLGELPMDVGAPAVVAAIADATGAWIAELPATPERILAALGPGAAPDGGFAIHSDPARAGGTGTAAAGPGAAADPAAAADPGAAA
jgi:CO/xanthine dehydrogenase Mo-binding subunit